MEGFKVLGTRIKEKSRKNNKKNKRNINLPRLRKIESMDSIKQITSPDLFSRLCKALFAAEYTDFQTIDDSGGDKGNDGYSESQKALFAFYCPEKPNKINDSKYKLKIEEDLNKAKKLADSGKYVIEKWIFVTPAELRESVQTYIRTEATERGFSGIAWASPKLTELFAKHSHLRSQFPDLIQPDVEQKIDVSTSKIIEQMESVDDVKKEYQTKTERNFQRRIDEAKTKLDAEKNETAKKEYEIILRDLNSETGKIDPYLFFRTYNNLGVCELNLGNPDKAAELFKRAYSYESEKPIAIANYALSKLLENKPKDGLPIIEGLLQEQPNHNHAISVKANILYALKQYDELIPFLKEKGKTSLMYWYEGFKAMDEKDYNKAIFSFEKVINLEPKNIRAHLLAAQNVMVGTKEFIRENAFPTYKIPTPIKEKFTKSISWLKKAIELLQDAEQKTDLEMAYTNLSGCCVAIGLFDETIEAAEKAIAIDSTSPIPFLNKGIAQLKTSKHKEAISSFQKYKELGGGDIDADRHIAFCSLKVGDLDTAEKIIVPLLEQKKDLDLDIAELGVELYSRRLNDEKLKALLKRIEMEFPENPQALRIRALYLQRLGLPEAESLLQKALECSKSESEKILTEMDLADFFYDVKDYCRAAEIYQRYADTTNASLGTLRYAECLYNSGQYGKLLQWIDALDVSVRKHPLIQQTEAYSNLYLYNLERASSIFKKLFEKDPNNLKPLVFYGMCKFRLGQEAEAKKAYDAVKNRITETIDIATLVGGYEFIGEWKIALELAYKALENDPNNPKAHLVFIFTFLRREQVKGEEIDSKYIKAFQKSIGEFNKRFPEEKALQGFEIKDKDISPILKMADRLAESTENATGLYKESKVPLAVIPKFTNRKPFDVWAAFTQMVDVGIKISFGAPDEIETESSIIDEHYNRTIVVDIYPLFLLAHFDRLDLLKEMFKKIYVHQSVLDELIETIDDRKISINKGQQIFGKIDGQYKLIYIPPEQVQKTIVLLEKIRDFLSKDKSCEIQGLSRERSEDERNLINALHETTRNSILLAEDLNLPLYCDDRILRVVLKNDYKIKSFSSQALINSAHIKKIISLDERFELQRRMIDLRYEFISINAAFIYTNLKKANYSIEEIESIISALVRKETTIQSLGVVLGDFFFLLMADQSIDSENKARIFKHILSQAIPNHDLARIEENIFITLQNRVKPEKRKQLRQNIRRLFQDLT